MIVSDRHGLKEPERMEDLQMKIIDTLRDHCTYNSQAQKIHQYFSHILAKIPDLRTLSKQGIERLYQLIKDKGYKAPVFIENLFIASQLPF